MSQTETTTAMKNTMIRSFATEMEREAVTTRRMLERIPDDKYDWKPHEKSMNITRLASHIAELPGWTEMTMKTNSLDFAKGDYKPEFFTNTKDLLAFFDRVLASALKSLETATDEILSEEWTLRNGEKILSVSSKADVIRMSYCQIVHHRAQLGVYLRLLNVPLPQSYGPSADEGSL